MQGPRIHRNYNGWIELLAREIRVVAKNPPEPPQPTADYVADELEKLHSLVERGILTQEEFDLQKRRLLAR